MSRSADALLNFSPDLELIVAAEVFRDVCKDFAITTMKTKYSLHQVDAQTIVIDFDLDLEIMKRVMERLL